MYDVIIIGGGIAGLTAGIYAARAGLKTVIIEKEQTGGQAVFADKIENFPGFTGSGFELTEKTEAQAITAGAEIVYDEITAVSFSGKTKLVKGEENEYQGKTVILALGATHKKAGSLHPYYDLLLVFIMILSDAAMDCTLFIRIRCRCSSSRSGR